MEFSYISGKGNSEKMFYISEKLYSEPEHNGTFLYFGKGIFRTLAHLELKAYSEPCYIQNLRHIQNTVR